MHCVPQNAPVNETDDSDVRVERQLRVELIEDRDDALAEIVGGRHRSAPRVAVADVVANERDHHEQRLVLWRALQRLGEVEMRRACTVLANVLEIIIFDNFG